MTKLSVDFSQVEDFEAIPAGTYPVVIESVEVREPKETGKYAYLNFTLIISDGEYESRKLWWIGSLSPKALFRLKAFFDSFGFEGDQAELDYDPGSGILLTPSFAGMAATAEVSVEAYQGKDRNRVEELYAGAGADPIKSAKKGEVLAKKPAKVKEVAAVEEAVDDTEDEDPDAKTTEADESTEETVEVQEVVEEEAPAPKVAKANPFAPKTGTAPRKVFK